MRLAVHTNAFRDMDFHMAVEQCSKFPGVLIEASTCREHLYKCLSNEALFKLLRTSPPENIGAISGGWTDFVRGKGIEEFGILYNQLELAVYWKVPLRLFFSNPSKEPRATEKAMERGIDNLCRVSDAWRNSRVRICIENHGGPTANPADLNAIILNVNALTNSRMVGITLDPANFIVCGVNPQEIIDAINPAFIFHVHAKDITTTGEFCAVGSGLMRGFWKTMVNHLKSVGYNGIITVEYEGKDIRNRIIHIRDSLNFLQELIND